MMRSEYLLMLDKTILVDCCRERKEQLQQEGWIVEVLAYGENLAVATRACNIRPCMGGAKCG